MALMIWTIVFVFVILFAFVALRMSWRNQEEGLQDTGLAILEFGRAFPAEAIRQLQKTADGNAVFVRLHDNKAGFLKSMRNHFACRLIEPGRVRVQDSGSADSLTVEFLDAPHHNGTYRFATPAEAAEVSLWLLGNYVSDDDLTLPERAPAANS